MPEGQQQQQDGQQGQQGQQGNATGGTATAPSADAGRRRHPTKKVDGKIRALIEKHGSATRALDALTRDLLDAEDEVETMRARLPKDTDVVIPKAEADAYRALGAPDKVAAAVKRAGELEAKEAQRAKADAHRKLGTDAGVNADALVTLAGSQGFDVVEAKEVEVDGRKSRVLMVRPAGDEQAAPVPLAEFAKARQFEALLPALSAGAGAGSTNGSNGSTGNGGGVPFAAQAGGSGGASAGSSMFAKIRQEEAARVESQRRAASAGTGAQRLGLRSA